MKLKGNLLVFFILIYMLGAQASDFRMRAMGGIRIALPDADNQLNLYRYAANMAGLQENDSTDWMKFRYNSASTWGTLRRRWDSAEKDVTSFSFSGQKYISDTQVFYGSIQYDYNIFKRLSYAIEPEPYALDPFVLTDTTTGNTIYSGPHVFTAFNHRLLKNLWWGASVDYQISRGLKDRYTRPEIIRRAIRFGLDLLYTPGCSWTVGLSFRPYDIRDLTKLVRQPDGQSPLVLRYRGEYYFSSVLGDKDRTAKYKGYEIVPQLAYNSVHVKGVLSASYYYRWLELFDGTTIQNYNGYYQEERYTFNSVWRYYPFAGNGTVLALNYNFVYIANWAREPIADYEIYRAFYHQHQLTTGVSYPWESFPVITAVEIQFKHLLPDRRDYLAHVLRRGAISDTRLRLGAEWRTASNSLLQAGCILQQYRENAVWRYWGNYHGAAVTFGTTLRTSGTEFEFSGYYGYLFGETYGHRYGNHFDFSLQIKRALN